MYYWIHNHPYSTDYLHSFEDIQNEISQGRALMKRRLQLTKWFLEVRNSPGGSTNNGKSILQCFPSLHNQGMKSFGHKFIRELHVHNFSTQTSTKSALREAEIQNKPQLTLKQLVRPFLMRFHPDRQGIETSKDTVVARDVNLQALQTINGLIDTIDQIYDRAAEPSKTSRGRLEVQKKYVIEFLVSSDPLGRSGVKKRKDVPIASRRIVEISFSERDINSVQLVDAASGKYSISAAISLRTKAMQGIVKLLRVAGLQIPNDLQAQIEDASREIEAHQFSANEILLEDELDLEGSRRQSETFGRTFNYSSTRPKTPYEKARERYIKTVDWKKFNNMYDEALKDMEKDLATEGLITMSEERKQRFVAEIISRVRIFDKSIDRDDDQNSESIGGLDSLHQLIAIRRLSLLLNDHFEDLEMEEMGRLWETTTMVLTPERKSHQKGRAGLPYSRLKRLQKGKESGFKFLFHSDDRLTVYVPIDFLDDEFIGEMKVHLSDFHALCLSKSDLDSLFPSHYSDFKIHPNIDD